MFRTNYLFAVCCLVIAAPAFAGGENSAGDLRIVHAVPVSTAYQLTESERFEREKIKRTDVTSAIYAASLKPMLNKKWAAPPHRGLLATRINVVIGSSGKLSEQRIVASSHNHEEDASATSLVASFSFPPLPELLQSLDLELCFMSDGTMNMVEVKTQRRPTFPTHHAHNLDASYAAAVEQRVKKYWSPTQGFETRTVFADCRIDKNGKISNLRLEHSSGLTDLDQTALRAVTDAQPFGALPPGGPDEVDMRFIFSAAHHEQFVPHSLINHHQDTLQPAHAQVNSDLSAYMMDSNLRVTRAWAPPKMTGDNRVVVEFKLHSTGQVTDFRISHSSGLVALDQSAVKAIQKACPFGALPRGAYENIDVQYTFNRGRLKNGIEGTILGTTR